MAIEKSKISSLLKGLKNLTGKLKMINLQKVEFIRFYELGLMLMILSVLTET